MTAAPTAEDKIEFWHMFDPLDWDGGPLQRLAPSVSHPPVQPRPEQPHTAPLAPVWDPFAARPDTGTTRTL